MNLFRDLENTISRVAKLRVTLKKEAEKVREMNSWLKNEEAKFECGLDVGGTPSPMSLATSGMFKLEHVSVIDPKIIKKRRLIEQFWTEVIAQQKNVSIDQTDLSMYLHPTSANYVPEEPKPEKTPESKLPHPSRKVRRKKSNRERHHD